MAIPRIKARVPFSKEQSSLYLKRARGFSVKAICAKYKISDGRYRYWRKTISGIEPRKQLSSQQKLRILEEGYQNGIKETCAAHGIDPMTYFRWKKQFGFSKSRPRGRPRRFTKEETSAIIKEAEKTSTKTVCRKYGIRPSNYSIWRYDVTGTHLTKRTKRTVPSPKKNGSKSSMKLSEKASPKRPINTNYTRARSSVGHAGLGGARGITSKRNALS